MIFVDMLYSVLEKDISRLLHRWLPDSNKPCPLKRAVTVSMGGFCERRYTVYSGLWLHTSAIIISSLHLSDHPHIITLA